MDLGDFDSKTAYAQYNEFEILDITAKYALVVQGYSGTAGDSLMSHNIMRFSTKDKDHNTNIFAHCAQEAQGGWWLTACFSSFLNGPYLLGNNTYQAGINWPTMNEWSLKFTEMKLRRK